jgi:hypothetical protein
LNAPLACAQHRATHDQQPLGEPGDRRLELLEGFWFVMDDSPALLL